MWGVSWSVVMLMMADAQRTDYESSKDNKGNNKDMGSEDVLDLSDPRNIEKLKRLAQ